MAIAGHLWLSSRDGRRNELAKIELAREKAMATEQLANLKGDEKKTYLRAEFVTMVNGKTTAEVKALLGEPDSTWEADDSHQWLYRSRTHKPVTGYVDPLVHVIFRNGACDTVHW